MCRDMAAVDLLRNRGFGQCDNWNYAWGIGIPDELLWGLAHLTSTHIPSVTAASPVLDR
jgi:hypothetical protein